MSSSTTPSCPRSCSFATLVVDAAAPLSCARRSSILGLQAGDDVLRDDFGGVELCTHLGAYLFDEPLGVAAASLDQVVHEGLGLFGLHLAGENQVSHQRLGSLLRHLRELQTGVEIPLEEVVLRHCGVILPRRTVRSSATSVIRGDERGEVVGHRVRSRFDRFDILPSGHAGEDEREAIAELAGQAAVGVRTVTDHDTGRSEPLAAALPSGDTACRPRQPARPTPVRCRRGSSRPRGPDRVVWGTSRRRSSPATSHPARHRRRHAACARSRIPVEADHHGVDGAGTTGLRVECVVGDGTRAVSIAFDHTLAPPHTSTRSTRSQQSTAALADD